MSKFVSLMCMHSANYSMCYDGIYRLMTYFQDPGNFNHQLVYLSKCHVRRSSAQTEFYHKCHLSAADDVLDDSQDIRQMANR